MPAPLPTHAWAALAAAYPTARPAPSAPVDRTLLNPLRRVMDSGALLGGSVAANVESLLATVKAAEANAAAAGDYALASNLKAAREKVAQLEEKMLAG